MKKKINIEDLVHGMWVSELDRPWRETSFLFQGFEIQSDEVIEEIRKYCKYVYIDTDISVGVPYTGTPGDDAQPGKTPYLDKASIEEEIETAREIHQDGTDAIAELMDAARLGKKLNVVQADKTVVGMLESIIRNPDAFSWLTKLKDKDTYTYSHSLDVCAFALIFGRHLGLSKEELKILGTGALLLDIGKTRVPTEILEKPGELTEREFEIIKTHVSHSVKIMTDTVGIPQEIIEIAHTHHERHNGSGYPRALLDKDIPTFGKMAGIVDCYDAITSDRVYRSALTSHQALRQLYGQRGTDFQPAMIEQFIECIGIYPLGSLVELSTGEIGIVISQSRVRSLRPKVMLILNQDKESNKTSPIIDLMTQLSDYSGNPLEIKEVLEPGTYGINPKDFYL